MHHPVSYNRPGGGKCHHHTSTCNIYKMNGDEEDTHVPDETVPVTTAPVTTAPTTTTISTTMVPVYQPLNLQVTARQKTGAAFDWLMQDTTTHETWLLTPGSRRKSWYEYEPVREMGTRPRCGEGKMGWEDHLTRLERLQDWLAQAVEEAVLEISAMLARVVQAKLQLRQPQDQ
ncbi:UNVERIFIED_CONTAM: hypothetical protein K2H54_047113 [Gekko kuhli]